MLRMIKWIDGSFGKIKPDRRLALRAIDHLNHIDRKHLFSDEISDMRTAEGRWFEGLIYEIMCELAQKTDLIGGIVMKGPDMIYARKPSKPTINGTCYSKRGDLKVKGNSQDLAEIDLIIIDNEGRLAFAEIITSGSDLKDFEKEIAFKKRLLGYLFGQPNVPFLLISSVDISRNRIINRLLKDDENALIITSPCEILKKLIRPSDLRKNKTRKPAGKLVPIYDMEMVRNFDYKALHDARRSRIITEIEKGKDVIGLKKGDEIPPIVKKIIFGGLEPPAISYLCRRYPLRIKGKEYDSSALMKRFSKVVFAVDLPDFEPVVYLRSRYKREFFKMVPDKSGGFRYQGLRKPHMKGFFNWLESAENSIDRGVSESLFNCFLTKRK